MWWALFARTGLLPRIAKRMMTAREARDFAEYCARYPIDDESNHHVPIASLHATVVSMMGGKGGDLTDYLVFKPRNEDVDIEAQLMGLDW